MNNYFNTEIIPENERLKMIGSITNNLHYKNEDVDGDIILDVLANGIISEIYLSGNIELYQRNNEMDSVTLYNGLKYYEVFYKKIHLFDINVLKKYQFNSKRYERYVSKRYMNFIFNDGLEIQTNKNFDFSESTALYMIDNIPSHTKLLQLILYNLKLVLYEKILLKCIKLISFRRSGLINRYKNHDPELEKIYENIKFDIGTMNQSNKKIANTLIVGQD